MEGRVFQTMGKQHLVWIGTECVRAFPGGRLALKGDGSRNRVAVGDIVTLKKDKKGTYLIEGVSKRRNKISRRLSFSGIEHIVAANLDLVAIVLAPRPYINTGLLDRYLVEAHASDIKPLVIVNKVDLVESISFPELEPYKNLDYEINFLSAVRGDGIEAFTDLIKGQWTVLVGHSGVGKTTLVNTMVPGTDLVVGDVSEKTGRGRHTTTSATAHMLGSGTVLVDTAGIREFGLWEIDWRCVEGGFLEIHEMGAECRYPDCRHLGEPECAVREAVSEGKLSSERYKSYENLIGEIERQG